MEVRYYFCVVYGKIAGFGFGMGWGKRRSKVEFFFGVVVNEVVLK